MNKTVPVVLALLIVAVSWPAGAAETSPTPSAAEAIPLQRVAVLELNIQGRYAHQLREWLPAFIESKLVEAGWTILARGETMEQIQREHNLPGIDPTTAPPENKLYGATALLKLTARVDVQEIDAIAHIGFLSIGGLVKAKFHLNGEMVDTGTGVIQPIGVITANKSKLRRLAVVFPTISWIGGGYNISQVSETLVGAAANEAAKRLVKRLEQLRPLVPGRPAAIPVQQQTVVLSFPEAMRPAPGAEYGIYRGDRLIAKVRVISFHDGRATCRVLAATDQIRSTDRARPLEVVVEVEVEL